MKLPLARVADILSATGEFNHQAIAQAYSIDSRTIQPGELFFAVKGERMDGHDFVHQALEKGAAAAIIRKDQTARYPVKAGLMAVDDTLIALQDLGAEVRRLWGKPLVGVTGSTGKTTTKDAIAHVLSSRFRVLKSEGNFNNHFGLPLMLLKIEPEHEAAVIEMGMSHRGEIAALAKIAQPEVGVVTNVAPVHLEFFKSVAEIAEAKRELVESLPPSGTAILNADDPYVSRFDKNFRGKVVRFGLHASSDVRAESIEQHGSEGSTFDVMAEGRRERATLRLVGTHNVYNALAAVAAGLEQGLSLKRAAGALATLVPADKRGAVVQVGNITIINDCYNSNPTALNAMVDTLAAMPAKRRIVIAGEMLELGPTGEKLHRESGQHMAKKGIDMLIGVRGLAKPMVEAASAAGMKAEFVATPEEAGEWLVSKSREGDVVLLKASRGVKLERALETVASRQSTVVGKSKAADEGG
jgi:UDP-N-acetylmuramoyl-tripeptide--D-alanyl-D-alanine ligase